MASTLAIKSLPPKGISVDFGGIGLQKWGGNFYTSQWASQSGGAITTTGTIAAALRFKCEQFAEASFGVVERKKNESGRIVYDLIEDHPLSDMLAFPCGQTRGAMSRSEFMSRMVASFEMDGNAYALRLRHPRFGYTIGFQYLPHWRVSPMRNPRSTRGVDYYNYTSESGAMRIEADAMVHWKQGQSPYNECLGWSPLRSVIAETLTEREASAYTAYIVGNMGVGSRVVSPKTLDESVDWGQDTTDAIKEKLRKLKGEGRGEDMVLDIPVDLKELTSSPENMALDKINQIPQSKILAVMNVDPVVVHLSAGQAESKSTDKKTVYENAWKASLLPLGTSFCDRLNLDVLADYASLTTHRVVLNTKGVWALQEDQNQLHSRWQKTFLSNIAEQNEAREALGLDARDGGERTNSEFPQLINGNAGNSILNGTNDKLPNETDRAHQKGAVEVGS